MAKIIVFGAAGRTGKNVVEMAIQKGHEVTAFVHSTEVPFSKKIPILKGNVLHEEDVLNAVDGQDLVISCVGSLGERMAEAVENIAKAMLEKGVPRLITIAAAGVLRTGEHSLRRDAPEYPLVFIKTSAQHLMAFNMLSQSGLEFTMVCPPRISPDEPLGAYRTQKDFYLNDTQYITVKDLADFIVNEVEERQYPNCRVAISV